MITIKADEKNKRVFIKFETLAHDALYEIGKGFHDAGLLMERDLKAKMRYGARSGKVYRHYDAFKGSYLRRSSAKGEYPQRITGTLRDSVYHRVFDNTRMVFGVRDPSRSGVSTDYARYIEGEPMGSGSRARNFVGYTIDLKKNEVRNIMTKRLNAGVKR